MHPDEKKARTALALLGRYAPCAHENHTQLGTGSEWGQCEDCGARFVLERLADRKAAAAAFDDAVGVIGCFIDKRTVNIEGIRFSLPTYRWFWSIDGRACALWLDRGDRAELLGTIRNEGVFWTIDQGDLLPIRRSDRPDSQGYTDPGHAALYLLKVFDAPLVKLPERS